MPSAQRWQRNLSPLCKAVKVRCLTHVLVLLTFVGPAPNGMICRHFPDREPTNNRIENLRWGTWEENRADTIVHGTDARGEKSVKAKLTDAAVASARSRYIAGTSSCRQLADENGVPYHLMWKALKHRTWKHLP